MFELKKIEVKNFKIFKNFSLNINSKNLSLLDGPNGFGKTSFYDALELVLLGKVQRYIDIESKTVHGRKKEKKFPLMYNRAEPQDELSVKITVEIESGNIVTLKRSAKCSTLMRLKSMEDANFVFRAFKNDEEILESDESKVLTRLLGDSYQRNYSLFHYIEQEENTALLKTKSTDKQQKIDHLFDVSEYREKINKIESIRSIIQPLQTPKKKEALDALKNEIVILEKELTPQGVVNTPYTRLIDCTEQVWDKSDIVFSPGSYTDWLGDGGDLKKLIQLKGIQNQLSSRGYNNKIKQQLFYKDKVAHILLRYGKNLGNISEYKKQIDLFEDSKLYLESINKGVHFVIESNRMPSELLELNLSQSINFLEMKAKIEEIREQIESSGKLSSSLNKVISSRNQFLEDYENHLKSEKESVDGICPTCGFDWEDKESLYEHFESQKNLLESLLDSNGQSIQLALKTFEQLFLTKLKSKCTEIVEHDTPSIDFKKGICKLTEAHIDKLNSLKEEYNGFKIDLTDYYPKTFSMDETLKIDELNKEIENKFKPVEHDLITPDLEDLFNVIFKSSLTELTKIEVKSIEAKALYLKYKYAEAQIKGVQVKKEYFEKEKSKYEKAKKLSNSLKNLLDLYNENVNQYISSISKSIEILFHIYSGRLLQNFHNGLGIFIETDGKSVTFKDTPYSTHDVIFSMSSGQLSSLIIAFTMALNHKYAKNKLLLIDDPVQTMDEINSAGFIDLLRHQFNDRQIFISTHEDHTSSYFRYKFKKAGLEHKRINFNEISKKELEESLALD